MKDKSFRELSIDDFKLIYPFINQSGITEKHTEHLETRHRHYTESKGNAYDCPRAEYKELAGANCGMACRDCWNTVINYYMDTEVSFWRLE